MSTIKPAKQESSLSQKSSTSKMKASKPDCSLVNEAGKSNFLMMMKRFTGAHKPQCKTALTVMPRMERAPKEFMTGSRYEGTWDLLGVCGYGNYTYPSGVVYEGDFEDGHFHGEGELRYESGAVLRGSFNKGEMTKRNLIFADGLEYAETDWMYCRMPDRRYTIEYDFGIQAASDSFLTADLPTPELAPDTYDAGDGVLDPKTRVVFKYDDPHYIVRCPSVDETKWIEANCRTSRPLPHEPRPYLYETWSPPELELPPLPPPAARMAGPDLSLYDFNQRDSSRSSRTFSFFQNLDDFADPAWRRRQSTASSVLAPKMKKALFYKATDPAIIPRDTIPESDDEEALLDTNIIRA